MKAIITIGILWMCLFCSCSGSKKTTTDNPNPYGATADSIKINRTKQ